MRLVVMLDENSRSSSPEGGSAKKAEPEVIGLPVDLIHDAKLVLTDELIRASLARAKAQGQKWAEGGELEEPDLNNSELNDGPSRD